MLLAKAPCVVEHEGVCGFTIENFIERVNPLVVRIHFDLLLAVDRCLGPGVQGTRVSGWGHC